MGTTKQCVFNPHFNDRGDKVGDWAEKTRDSALAHLKRLFENEAKFSCIAKDRDNDTLLLRGCVNLNSPCTQECIKKMLGKCSGCKPSHFGDMVSSCRLLHINGDLTTAGGLPAIGGDSIKKMKPFATDPQFVIKIPLDSIDRKGLVKKTGVNQLSHVVDNLFCFIAIFKSC